MRDDRIRARLAATNPWWSAPATGASPTAWTATDVSLRGRRRFDLGYRAPILADVAAEPLDDRLIVLRGPRRVGKSVVLKDTIAARFRPRSSLFSWADPNVWTLWTLWTQTPS